MGTPNSMDTYSCSIRLEISFGQQFWITQIVISSFRNQSWDAKVQGRQSEDIFNF